MADFKFLIRASEYYRNLLKSEVRKTELTMEKPDLISGLEVLNNDQKSNSFLLNKIY